MSCLPEATVKERHLHDALRHLMFKNHPLDPALCEGCLEIAAFLAVPGYRGGDHPEVH